MSGSPLFEIESTPIGRGVTLIEASAGTGKTYTIAGLFLRLLLEDGLMREGPRLGVREILVVTFTEAATEELRGRIRDLIAGALEAFRGGKSADPLVAAVIERHAGEEDEMRSRLEAALANFDEAPIFTIHGFCHRVLKDRAFESGVLFDAELIDSQDEILREIAEDFWRRSFYPADALLSSLARQAGLMPAELHRLARDVMKHPRLRVISAVDDRPVAALVEALRDALGRLCEIWRRERETILGFFGPDSAHFKAAYRKAEFPPALAAAMESLCSDLPTPEATGFLDKLDRSKLEKELRAGAAGIPAHPFFAACGSMLGAIDQWRIGMEIGLVRFVRAELPRRKERLKVQSYDDLLTRVDAAVNGPHGDTLAGELRGRYRAALIDEFQDTDPVQWEIFRRAFAHRDGVLFLIGDPKQAIYGFRGADVFTYLAAAKRTDRRYTLGRNWRSTRALVNAVNTLFSGRAVDRPFFDPAIAFTEMAASDKAEEKPLSIPNDAGAPLELWFHPRGARADIARGAAGRQLPRVVASEIARLLNRGATVGGRELRPENIAVLLDSNAQARVMQEALMARGIPSVLHTEASVFTTGEARDLGRLLAAITQPANEKLVRTALATDLVGLGAAELESLCGEDAAAQARWQSWLEIFQGAHAAWSARGFMPMFRRFTQEQHVRARLLAFSDGERRLTNLLHLAEALHRAAVERRLGMSGLLKWFAEQRDAHTHAPEEHQLRLERDDNAVRLVTIHKSKGLEYDIVFCPFVWRSARADGEVLFHDREGVLTRDLGSDEIDEHRRLCLEERLAENLRLFYVTLTRARHRCCVVWGAFNRAALSAPVWLFHQPSRTSADLAVEMTEKLQQDDAALRGDLEAIARRSQQDGQPASILVRDLPVVSDEAYRPADRDVAKLGPRKFNGRIPRGWRVASFSWLTARREDERPDRDAVEIALEDAEAPGGIFAFPRGRRAGTCLHEIFEQVEFTSADHAEIERIAVDRLRANGIAEAGFVAPVVQTVQRTLAAPLVAGEERFRLSEIGAARRLNELEFNFPLRKISPADLQNVFAKHGRQGAAEPFTARPGRLEFDPVRGFMKGFIDLVFEHGGKFYLVDWKSNWLGNRVEDYDAAAIGSEMNRHAYGLQYHLYTLALDRYLALRRPGYDYARDFGGVFYLFVRGIDPGRPAFGVFHDRPEPGLIRALGGLLLEESK